MQRVTVPLHRCGFSCTLLHPSPTPPISDHNYMSLIYIGPYSLTTCMEMKNPFTVPIFFTRKTSTSSFIKIYDLLQIATFFLFLSLLVPHPPFSKVDHYGSLVHIYSNRNSFCPWVFAIRGQVNLKVPTGH